MCPILLHFPDTVFVVEICKLFLPDVYLAPHEGVAYWNFTRKLGFLGYRMALFA